MTTLERRGDRWRLSLAAMEGRIVAALPEQLRLLLEHPDHNRRVIERLFPISYDDPEEQRLNRELLGASLMEERRDTVAAVATLLDVEEGPDGGRCLDLDEAGMDLLLRFLNDVRLVIATDLGVEDSLDEQPPLDPDDEDGPRWALLEYLGVLETLMVEALTREI